VGSLAPRLCQRCLGGVDRGVWSTADSGGRVTEPAGEVPLSVLTDDGKVRRPKLPGGDAFVDEIKEVVRAIRSGTPSKPLAGELACDAVVLCQKQTPSAQARTTGEGAIRKENGFRCWGIVAGMFHPPINGFRRCADRRKRL
jgi:hypothetical protein